MEELLDISRIEAGEDSISVEPVDLAELLQRVLDGKTPSITKKALVLDQRIPSRHTMVPTDRRHIVQILNNLLSNAIKFSNDHGRITVSVDICDDHFVLGVSDTGAGMSENQIEIFFSPFKRTDQDPLIAEKGWGLGLAIVKSLVALHGGEIDVESALDQGTAIKVTMPIHSIASQAA